MKQKIIVVRLHLKNSSKLLQLLMTNSGSGGFLIDFFPVSFKIIILFWKKFRLNCVQKSAQIIKIWNFYLSETPFRFCQMMIKNIDEISKKLRIMLIKKHKQIIWICQKLLFISNGGRRPRMNGLIEYYNYVILFISNSNLRRIILVSGKC